MPWSLYLLAAAWLAGYLVACRFWPYASCMRCKGTTKARQPGNARAWRPCPRCHGTGRRLRLGRAFMNHAHSTRKGSR